jgi:hypothetical protein
VRRFGQLATLGVASALCQLALAIAFAPALIVCLAFTPPRRGPGKNDMNGRLAQCCVYSVPPVIGAWALFLAWRLHMPWGPRGAIVVGILFGVESLLLAFVVAVSFAFGNPNPEGREPPDRPLIFYIGSFCIFASMLIMFSLPLALIVAVVALAKPG